MAIRFPAQRRQVILNKLMRVFVHYLAQVKQAAGIASEQVEVADPCAVREFIARLAQGRGGALRDLLLTPDDELQPTLLIFLDDRQITRGSRAPVYDGAVITLLSPIAGG